MSIMSKGTVAFHTLGCKVNQNETEAMSALFLEAGYTMGDFEGEADVYVINTCTVTHLSDRKSRQMIRRAHKANENSIIVVTGCYAQVSPKEVAGMDDVDLVVGNNQRLHLVELVEQFQKDHLKVSLVTESKDFKDFEELPVERLINKTRAYLKVQEGCEQFCTYCIIPYARGPLRSRGLESTIKEAKKLEAAGFQEIILTGIHLGAYGQEATSEGLSLVDLCQALLKETAIERIRLSSIEPTEVSAALLDLMKHNPRMCPHLHIPLQSGDDQVLSHMHRPYDTETFRQQVQKIRVALPDVAISTDLMVGFPGETDDQFRNCLVFCDEMSFSSMHIFKYSPREGTPAATYEQQISAQLKEQRSKKMTDVAEKHAKRFMLRFIGRVLDVLVEDQNSAGHWEGHTNNYLKVVFTGAAEKGKVVRVMIDESDKKNLKGHLYQDEN